MRVLRMIFGVIALLFFTVYLYSASQLLFEHNDSASQLVLISAGVALLFALLVELRAKSYLPMALLLGALVGLISPMIGFYERVAYGTPFDWKPVLLSLLFTFVREFFAFLLMRE